MLLSIIGFGSVAHAEVIIATGLKSAVYSKILQAIIRVAPPGMVAEYQGKTTGGQDNIDAMLHDHDADAGMAQVDVVEFMKRTRPAVKNIYSLAALHKNYLYIITLKNGVKDEKSWNPLAGKVLITNWRQLPKRTAGLFSSAQVTGRVVNERLQYNMKMVDINTKEDGFRMLKEGKIAVFMFTGGERIPWVENEVNTNEFSFVRANREDIEKILGAPYSAGRISYRKFGASGIGVTCLTVPNELYCWNYTGPRSQELLNLRHFLEENIESIKELRGVDSALNEMNKSTLQTSFLQRYMPGK